MQRVIPVIKEIAERCDVTISIDTYKSSVADAALIAGASVVNDISGLSFDPDMGSVVASHKAALIAMHIKGTPKTMQQNPTYHNVVEEVKMSLSKSAERAVSAGIEHLMLDPGIGFGKNLQHNLTLIKHLVHLQSLAIPS